VPDRALPALPAVLPPPTATFARDAEAHYLDRPRHCPDCGRSLADGLVVEYWVAEDRVFSTWCAGCSWSGEIVRTARTVGHEPGD
jgi:hypothetical protein